MMRRTRAVRVGLVLGLTLGLAACGETPPPTPATLLDASTAQQLFERLDRLASALEAMPRASAAPVLQVPTAERTVVADATTELTARIDALEREVAAMRKNMGTAFAPARATAILPMQTHSVVQMSEQLNSEDKTVLQSARRSLFLLTQQQVLERFGMPSDIGVNQDHSICWAWRDGDRHLLGVTFVDGVAVMFQ